MGRLRGFRFSPEPRFFYAGSKSRSNPCPREYSVGYKKPPAEYRFKKGNLAAHRKASLKDKIPDVVGHVGRPLKAERGGKRVNVHPLEAALLSLVREALKGKPSAIKKVIQTFEKEGLLEPPPGKQIHGALVVPKNLDLHSFCILLKVLGAPPWEPGMAEAAQAEYQQDDGREARNFIRQKRH